MSSRSSLHLQRVPDSLGGEGVDQTDLLDPGGVAQEASAKYEGRKGQGEEDTLSRLTSKVCGEKGRREEEQEGLGTKLQMQRKFLMGTGFGSANLRVSIWR